MILKKGFGILKRLRRGKRIYLFLTYHCTLDCFYCTNKAITGSFPVSKHIGLSKWKKIIKNHPTKVREVVITGGEPMLMGEDFICLVDWLIENKYFVTIFSNLTLKYGLRIKPSWRIRMVATYHRSMDIQEFRNNLELYKEKFRVDVGEVATNYIPGSKSMKMQPCYNHRNRIDLCGESGGLCTCFGDFYTPDGRLFYNRLKMLERNV